MMKRKVKPLAAAVHHIIHAPLEILFKESAERDILRDEVVAKGDKRTTYWLI